MTAAEQPRLSVAEYFRAEETAEVKHEFHHGELFAMTGASAPHNLIVSNLITRLNNALEGRNCFVFPGDIKVEVDPGKHYAYPDVSVVCGDVEFVPNRNDIVVNPAAIFEVLSPSTSDYDRGGKFRAYRRIASLRDYLLVDPYAVSVEHFHRGTDGRWLLSDHEGEGSVLRIESLGVELPLSRIYHRVDRVRPDRPGPTP
jgi:Uma2 family endonuclease